MPVQDKKMVSERLWISAMGQSVVYSAIWIWNEYVAFYLSVILPSIVLFLMILSLIADLIEPSRIPRWYYKLMLMSIIIPLIIGGVFFLIYEGRFDFLKN